MWKIDDELTYYSFSAIEALSLVLFPGFSTRQRSLGDEKVYSKKAFWELN